MTMNPGDLQTGMLPIGVAPSLQERPDALRRMQREGLYRLAQTNMIAQAQWNFNGPGNLPGVQQAPRQGNFLSLVEAERRSFELLREWLSPSQKQEYDLTKSFTVKGNHTGRRYRITAIPSYGINELSASGRIMMQLCLVPKSSVALFVGDIMLAQKIMLETDECYTRTIANFHNPNVALT